MAQYDIYGNEITNNTPFGWMESPYGVNAPRFAAIPVNNLSGYGSLSSFGKTASDWWNNTSWTGAGGKLADMANWGSKAMNLAGMWQGYNTLKSQEAANKLAMEGMRFKMDAAKKAIAQDQGDRAGRAAAARGTPGYLASQQAAKARDDYSAMNGWGK